MARIAGVDLPKNKRIEIGLTYIYGIGRSVARKICEETGVDVNTKTDILSEDDLQKLRRCIDQNFKVEGDLRRETALNIKRLQEIGSYRGLRHRRNLPVRGQRTKTNARQRRGPKRTVGVRRKK